MSKENFRIRKFLASTEVRGVPLICHERDIRCNLLGQHSPGSQESAM
jgi:hypothetical protein